MGWFDQRQHWHRMQIKIEANMIKAIKMYIHESNGLVGLG
jgi:hypothetical protein